MSHARHYKSILTDMILYGVLGVGSQLANILLLPLFTRLLSTEEYGTMDLVVVTIGLASPLMSLVLSSALFRYFYDCAETDRKRLTSTLFWLVALFSLFLGLLLYLLTPEIVRLTLHDDLYVRYFRLGWTAAAFTALLTFLNETLRIERRILALGAVNLTLFVVQIGTGLLFVGHFRLGISGALSANVASSASALVLGLFLTRRWLTASFSYGYALKSLKYSLPMMPAILTNWVNQRSTRFIILFYLSLSAVGIYGVGSLLASLMSFVVTAFQNSWNAYIMSIFKEEPIEVIHRRALISYLSGCFALGLVYLTLSKEICLFFLDPKYIQALPLLPWIMGGIILHGSGNITSFGIVMAEKTSRNSLAAWTGALLNIGLAFLLVPVIGLKGVAIGFFCAEGIFTILLTAYTYRLHSLRFDLKQVAVILGVYVLAAFAVSHLIEKSDDLLLRYAVGLGAALFLLYRSKIHQIAKLYFETA